MSRMLHPLQMNRHQRRAARVVAHTAPSATRYVQPPDMVELRPEIEFAGRLVFETLSGTITPTEAVNRVHLQLRGMIPRLLRDHGATPAMVREALHPAWLDCGVRVAGIEKRADVIDLFRFAQFPIPDEMPERLTVWRGTVGLTVVQARRGYSWSLHRGCACFFALEHWESSGLSGRPLVLRREIKRSALVYYHAEDPAEAGVFSEVIFDAHPAGDIDGDEEDWRRCKTPLPWTKDVPS